MKSTRFKIAVPSYNSVPFIEKTLASIESQTYRNYQVCVINDASTDPRQAEVIEKYCQRNGWLSVHNEKNMGTLHNLVHAFRAHKCEDDDVCISIDGDDWLFSPYVLEDIDKVYRTKQVLMCCGQPLCWKGQWIPHDAPTPPWWVRLRRSYRQWWWFPFGQLRSFKYVLWKNIKDRDLQDENGDYYKVTSDMAFMFPMAEMAGRRIHYESKVQLVVNDCNPISDNKIKPTEQQSMEHVIRNEPRYPVLAVSR